MPPWLVGLLIHTLVGSSVGLPRGAVRGTTVRLAGLWGSGHVRVWLQGGGAFTQEETEAQGAPVTCPAYLIARGRPWGPPPRLLPSAPHPARVGSPGRSCPWDGSQ